MSNTVVYRMPGRLGRTELKIMDYLLNHWGASHKRQEEDNEDDELVRRDTQRQVSVRLAYRSRSDSVGIP